MRKKIPPPSRPSRPSFSSLPLLSSFSKFVNFGSFGDRESRRALAAGLYNGLRLGTPFESGREIPPDQAVFAAAAGHILTESGARGLCACRPELAETVTRDVLEGISAAKREFDALPSPFETEEALLAEFADLKAPDFEGVWDGVAAFIRELYEPGLIDTGFYGGEFRRSIAPGRKGRRGRIGFERVRAHFVARWRGLLAEKERRREAEYLAARRDEYCQGLSRRVAAMRSLEELCPDGDACYLWEAGALKRADFDALNVYAEFLRRDPLLKAIAERLGRARKSETDTEEAEAGQADTAVYAGKADITGVRESDDLSSLVPSETALLTEETCRLLFFKKFAEKKLQTFAYKQTFEAEESRAACRRRKEVDRGPFVLCIDTSGSMRGAPETVAKTLCFALLKTALRERRACYLISFGVGAEALDLTNLAHALPALTAFLSESFYGGTNPMPALDKALRTLETGSFRKADVVMVSDFIMPPLDGPMRERVEAARAGNTKFHGLLVGDKDAQGVNRLLLHDFDSLWTYDFL